MRFTRRALREAVHWGDTQLKVHLARLTELEYLIAHRTRTGGFDYELVYDLAGDGEALRFPGLADIEALRQAYDAARSGLEVARSGSGRGAVSPRPGTGRDPDSPENPHPARVSGATAEPGSKTPRSRPHGQSRSYPQAIPLAAGV